MKSFIPEKQEAAIWVKEFLTPQHVMADSRKTKLPLEHHMYTAGTAYIRQPVAQAPLRNDTKCAPHSLRGRPQNMAQRMVHSVCCIAMEANS